MREGHRLSRRRFLGAMGRAPARRRSIPAARRRRRRRRAPRRAGSGFLRAEHFGRIFRLPPFAQQSPTVEAALRELGKPGGLLDAKDPLEAGPKQLIVDLSLSANNPNNPNHTAGTTFFGQFLDHDMTFDADSRLAPTDRTTDGAQLPHAVAGSGFGLRGRAGGPAGAVRPVRPRQAQARKRRPLRGPPASRGQHGDRRRPAQRREPDHRGAALRLRALPQPRGRPRARRRGSAARPTCSKRRAA